MPVRKYHSIEEMNADRQRLEKGDPRLPLRLRTVWNTFSLGTLMPRGVSKFHSIEEANADRERCLRERVERLRRERGKR